MDKIKQAIRPYSSFNHSYNHLLTFRKGRRKDKDLTPLVPEEEYKQYLEDAHVRGRIIDMDLSHLVRLPAGLDLHEWLATHSKYYDYYSKEIYLLK